MHNANICKVLRRIIYVQHNTFYGRRYSCPYSRKITSYRKYREPSCVLKKKHAPFKLAQYLKQQHTNQFHTVLNISDKSLTIEIIGHVYIGNFADTLKEIPRIPKIAPIIVKKAYKITDHTDIIDCGEKEVDSNRWVWDKLAVLYDTIMNNMYEVFQRNEKKN